MDAKLDYVTVPKIAEEAYLRAKITNTSDSILLPGPASIFHDDEFVGTTALETVVPHEEFEVQLGVDDRVKIERKLTEHTVGKTFIGNTRKSLFAYTITVTNNLPWPANVTVEDQYPVSRNAADQVHPPICRAPADRTGRHELAKVGHRDRPRPEAGLQLLLPDRTAPRHENHRYRCLGEAALFP